MPKKDEERNFLKRASDYGAEKYELAKEKTEEKIKEHPIESVLIAAGVGALIGAGVALWVSSLTRKRD